MNTMGIFNLGTPDSQNYRAKQEWRFETFVELYNVYASKYSAMPFQEKDGDDVEYLRKYKRSLALSMDVFAEKIVQIYGVRTGIRPTRENVRSRIDEVME